MRYNPLAGRATHASLDHKSSLETRGALTTVSSPPIKNIPVDARQTLSPGKKKTYPLVSDRPCPRTNAGVHTRPLPCELLPLCETKQDAKRLWERGQVERPSDQHLEPPRLSRFETLEILSFPFFSLLSTASVLVRRVYILRNNNSNSSSISSKPTAAQP